MGLRRPPARVGSERVETAPARADDEAPYSARPVEPAALVHRGIPLVVVVVAGQHKVRPRVVEGVPERGSARIVAVCTSGPPRSVPQRQDASRVRARQVGAKPPHLCAAGACIALGVERHNVPPSEVEAVVAAPGRPRSTAEIAEVPRRVAVVFVVPGRGPDARLVTSPRGPEAGPELLERSAVVRRISECEHHSSVGVEQRRGLLIAV